MQVREGEAGVSPNVWSMVLRRYVRCRAGAGEELLVGYREVDIMGRRWWQDDA